MKHLQFMSYIGMVLLVVLAACAPKATPTPIVVVVTATSPAAEAPVASEAPTEPSTTAALEPINLVPPMKVGSTFLYVDGTTLVAVPAGPFTMGRGGSDNPEHQVTLSDFWVYRTKVTNQQYALCVAVGQCTAPDLNDNQGYTDVYRLNDPISGVTWDQASAYCTFVHGRLPTEAEWEKTARGPDANIYPWGNGAPSCDLLNFNNCVGKPTDVNKYPQGQSYYEAYDMAGNASEWVADWYDPFYYRTGSTEDPLGPDTGQKRSVRSSSYKSNTEQVPAAVRFFDNPTDHKRDLGFRCVVEDPGYFAPNCTQIAYVGANVSGGGPIPQAVPAPNCSPDVSISTAGYCHTKPPPYYPAANLEIGPNPLPPLAPGMPVIPGGCTESPPGSGHYDCTGGGEAQIQRICTVPPPPVPPGCDAAMGYTPDPGDSAKCIYTGGGTTSTQCLPGLTYDPVNMCCASLPGTATNYKICPVSAPYYAGGICVPWPTSDLGPLHIVNVQLGSCDAQTSSGGGGEPEGQCPNGGTYTCTPDPGCSIYKPPSVCPLPDVCSCQ